MNKLRDEDKSWHVSAAMPTLHETDYSFLVCSHLYILHSKSHLLSSHLLTYKRVFLLWFVRLGNPTAQLTKMYDTSPESWARGAVYRLFFIPIAFIYCEYKAKKQSGFGAELSREVKLAVISHNFSASRKMFNILPFGPFMD